ncbi:hypothetical protein [uncultured Aeromicrobium sp.]|uniref:hypothetical protein n=1 Tax=uncultured Aeromicrobium sp. TaxID=337820 RepID=UPI0026004CD0|nr:hypothetical protein [uncultured Aeromicrobium sp.]
MARKGILGELSALQLIAGALAAMTSAWLASWLGVAGTLIGAAVGSIVAGVASTLYSASLQRGIERSKTLLVTEQGSVVEGAAEGEESTVEAQAPEDPAPRSNWKTLLARVNWKTVAIVSATTLLVAIAAIGAYEMISGRSFGNESNSRIVPSSVSRDGGAAPQAPDRSTPAPTSTTEPSENTPTPTPTATPSTTASPEPTDDAPRVPSPTPTLGESSPTPGR